MRKKSFFLFSFLFFFSDFWPKNFKKFSKLPSTCPEEQFVAWNFYLKFWIRKPLDMVWQNSIYVSRVKIAEKIVQFFRLLAKKLQQFFKNYLLRVQRNNFWLEFFFVKFWTVSDFLQKLLAWFSFQNFVDSKIFQTSIYVSRVKIAEKILKSLFPE